MNALITALLIAGLVSALVLLCAQVANLASGCAI